MAVSAIIGLVSALTTSAAGGALAGGFLLGAGAAGTIFTHFLVTTAIGAALSALTPKPSSRAGTGGYNATSSGANLDWQVIYGETKVAGVVAFNGTSSKNRLHRLLVFTGHEIEDYVDIYLDDDRIVSYDEDQKVVSVEKPDGTISQAYGNQVRVELKKGLPDQAASVWMKEYWEGDPETPWGDDYKLSGLSYAYVEFYFDREVFPNGVPEVTAVIRGRKVFDPRTGSVTWSDNPALCIADYITAPFGLNESRDRVDWGDVAAAADVCDEISPVDGKRKFTLNGTTLTSTTPYDFFSEALKSMGGLLWYSNGKWKMKAATWTEPVAHFTMDNLRSSVEVNTRHSRRDNFNAVAGTYRGPNTFYVATDFPEVTSHEAIGSPVAVTSLTIGDYYQIETLGTTDWNAIAGTTGVTYSVGDIFQAKVNTGNGDGTAYQTIDPYLQADGGQRSTLDQTLTFTDNYQGCKRLSRILLERNRQQLSISGLFDLSAMNVTVGDNVTLTLERFGWEQKVFEVTNWQLVLDEGSEGYAINVRMNLRETAESVFDEVDDGSVYEADNTTLASATDVDAPINLQYSSTANIDVDGKTISDITFSWDHPEPSGIAEYEVQWRKTGNVNWSGNAVARSTTFTLESMPSAVTWDWRVRAINSFDVGSDWVVGPSATVAADEVAPEKPTGITAQGGYRSVVINWEAPTLNEDASPLKDLRRYIVYRDGVFLASTDTTRFVDSGLTSATNYSYKVKAVDYSGNESAFSQSVNALVLADPADGVDGISILVVYADDATGTNQSLTPGSYEYVTYYEYNTSEGVPALPLPGGTEFVKFIGVGQSIFVIYAEDASGSNQSFTQGTRTYANFYERAGGAPTLPRTTDESGDPLVWVKIQGTDGDDGSNAQFLRTKVDKQTILYNGEGSLSPSSQTLTFSVEKLNISGTVSWTTSPNVKTGTGDTFTLSGTNFGTNFSTAERLVEVTAEVTDDGNVYRDTITCYALRSGSESITIVQSNESHSVTADSNGNPTDLTGSSNDYTVYQGARKLTPETGNASPPMGEYTIINAGVIYSNCAGPTNESTDGNVLTLGDITDITANVAWRDVQVRVGTYPDGELVDYTVRQSFSRVKDGATGNTGGRGAGRWDIVLPAGVTLPSNSNQARDRWNTYGRSNGNNAPATPVPADQAWFRNENNAQAVFICSSVTSETSHTWNEQDEVIDGNLLVTGSLNVVDAAIDGEIASNNWYSSGGTDGWIIRQDGSAAFNGPVLSRSLLINQGSFTLNGTIEGTAFILFANTGIRIGKDDVWRVNDKTFIVQAVVSGGVNADAGFDPFNTYWGIESQIFAGARWNGGNTWNNSSIEYRDDPPVIVDLPGRTGVDQRIMFNSRLYADGCTLVNPVISWKVFQVS